jgi:hypothetical protein
LCSPSCCLPLAPNLRIAHLVPPYPVPLLLVLGFIYVISRKLGRLFVLDFLGKDEVEDDGDEGNEGEARFADELDGVVEAEEGAVVATVGEDEVEPAGGRLAEFGVVWQMRGKGT